jgi:hypothetical protein
MSDARWISEALPGSSEQDFGEETVFEAFSPLVSALIGRSSGSIFTPVVLFLFLFFSHTRGHLSDNTEKSPFVWLPLGPPPLHRAVFVPLFLTHSVFLCYRTANPETDEPRRTVFAIPVTPVCLPPIALQLAGSLFSPCLDVCRVSAVLGGGWTPEVVLGCLSWETFSLPCLFHAVAP